MAMAVEDRELAVSTLRVSLSYDLPSSPTAASGACPSDASASSSPLSDFSFGLTSNVDLCPQVFSAADDLFSDGVLLPLPIKERSSSLVKAPPAPLPEACAPPKAEPSLLNTSSKKHGSFGEDVMPSSVDKEDVKKSSWLFLRSSSLNSGGRRAGLWPFPLLRSKSTGSSLNPTPVGSRDYKQYYYYNKINCTSIRRRSGSNANSSVSSSSSTSFMKTSNDASTKVYYYSGNSRRHYGAGVRIVPVLNLPTSKSMSIFSFFLGFRSKTCSREMIAFEISGEQQLVE